MNNPAHVLCMFSLKYILRSEIAKSYRKSERTTKVFSKAIAPFYLPSYSVWGFAFSHVFISLVLSAFGYSSPAGSGVVFHSGSDLQFPNTNMLDIFSCTTQSNFFLKKFQFKSCASFNRAIFLFIINLWVLYIFWVETPYQIYILQIWLPFCGCLLFSGQYNLQYTSLTCWWSPIH